MKLDMKVTMLGFCFGFCFFSAVGAMAQTSAPVLYGQPSQLVMIEHPEHAGQHAMAPDENLRGSSAYTYAQGEQPMWEFGSGKVETPLGDVARQLRARHTQDKKAAKVSTND